LRKLCVLLDLRRSSWDYKPKPDANEPIRKRLYELADERKRWGYRRLHYLLRREGFKINHKRPRRLYREIYLMLRVKRRRKMAVDTRFAPPKPERRNQCWSMDFMSDTCTMAEDFGYSTCWKATAETICGSRSIHQSTVIGYAAYWKGLPGSKDCRK